MKLEASTRILAVAGICAASLIALVVSEGFARESGQEITLPMEAVDPRAMLEWPLCAAQLHPTPRSNCRVPAGR
jgi:hypothetical protein